MTHTCLFCSENVKTPDISSDATKVICPRCGTYIISGSANATATKAEYYSARQKANISGWLRENPGTIIGSNTLEFFLTIPTPSFHEKANKLLLAFEKHTDYGGQYINTPYNEWLSVGYFMNVNEMTETLNYLREMNYILREPTNAGDKIAPNGWARLEEIRKPNSDSEQCFVAMWFHDSMNNVYKNTINPAVEDAGYESHRVDQGEFLSKIDDEIITQIRRSRFIVADFTGQRGGVYYEAGFAKGLGLEVIWTCREDEIEKLHFDIRQYNCIIWNDDDLGDFRKRLTFRIESIFGKGPYKRPE